MKDLILAFSKALPLSARGTAHLGKIFVKQEAEPLEPHPAVIFNGYISLKLFLSDKQSSVIAPLSSVIT